METETAPRKRLDAFRQYPAGFWWINAIELLERGAYYGMLSVFVVYMVTQRGFPEGLVGTLIASLQALLYFVPLVAGAMAEKYGYKRMILVAFGFAIAGYVSLAFTTGVTPIFLGLVVFGIGAGIFKPVAAACVSATTTPEQRNFGFTVYYMAINLGAFLVPLVLAVFTDPSQVGLQMDPLLPPEKWNLIFLVAGGLIAAGFILTLMFFRDVRPPDPSQNVLGALKALGNVFKMPSFLILLTIYAGFWFMYAQYQFVAALYMVDFGIFPLAFVPFYATINPLVIILAAPLVGKVIEKLPSLPVMMVGIFVYLVGVALMGLTRTPAVFLAGAVILSLGELITHPGFLAYVTKLAPKDKTAVYLGYAFIPTGVGLVFGGRLGLQLYGEIAVQGARPTLFWSMIVALGLVTVAALLVYNYFMTRRAEGAGGVVSRTRGLAGPAAALAVLLIAPLVLAGGVFAAEERSARTGGDLETTGAADPGGFASGVLATFEGETSEGAATAQKLDVNRSDVAGLMVTLRWTDEPASAPAFENAPDTFRVSVTLPDGSVVASEDVANDAGGDGMVALHVPLAAGQAAGEYEVTVEAVSCGDERVVGVGGLLPAPVSPRADGGNAWTLEVAYGDAALDGAEH